MRGCIYRRLELMQQGIGDVVVLGSMHCASTLRIKEFLTRNGHPFSYFDLDHERDVEALLDRFHVTAGDVPVVICRGEASFAIPPTRRLPIVSDSTPASIARTCRSDRDWGGGRPAGPAVYAASEGLDVRCRQRAWRAGGSSSRIENYLGFPLGVSGEELTSRDPGAEAGREIMVAKGVISLQCDRSPFGVARRWSARPRAHDGAPGRELPAPHR